MNTDVLDTDGLVLAAGDLGNSFAIGFKEEFGSSPESHPKAEEWGDAAWDEALKSLRGLGLEDADYELCRGEFWAKFTS